MISFLRKPVASSAIKTSRPVVPQTLDLPPMRLPISAPVSDETHHGRSGRPGPPRTRRDSRLQALLRQTTHAVGTWRDALPRGNMLRTSAWARRQRWIGRFALAQALGLGVVAAAVGRGPLDILIAALVPGVPAMVAGDRRLSRTARTLSTVTSLMFASATLVDLSNGLIEAHFHFFVMLGVVALYQDWAAFGLCALITMVHHAAMGLAAPSSVFSGGREQAHPIKWALIHAGFIAAASVTHMIAWRINEQQELRDPLTQLPNRARFSSELRQRAATGAAPVAILFVDVDDFKAINDSAGHHCGDAALTRLAGVMVEATRPDDLVARLGGDEFAVIVRGTVDVAAAIAERILDLLAIPVVIDGREVRVSVSIGVADDLTIDTRDTEMLLRAADEAMYAAKSAGGRRVVCFSRAMDQEVARRLHLTRDLATPGVTDQMHLLYQPVVDVASGRMQSVEALLRWEHPELGAVSPAEFIPLAEQSGAITSLGAWVLHEGCRQVAELRRERAGLADLGLSVNLAAQQLRDPGLLGTVDQALAQSGLPPESLTMEVTETSMLSELESAREQLATLRARGVGVAIDDFGTGYSSLTYLARLPVDTLKIDRSFVSALTSEPSALALVRCILDVARALDLRVIAEGVERPSEQQLLADLGCRLSQGFLFSRPLGPDALACFAADRADVQPASAAWTTA